MKEEENTVKMVTEENDVRRERREKSEDSVIILNEDENRTICESDLSPSKKESGYFEDNSEKTIDDVIEKYAKQYGGAILSIGCSISTESNGLVIDEEAGLLDQEDTELQGASTSFCLTEHSNVTDELDVRGTIEVEIETSEFVEDESMQIQCEFNAESMQIQCEFNDESMQIQCESNDETDPLGNIDDENTYDIGKNVIFNRSIKKSHFFLISRARFFLVNQEETLKMNKYLLVIFLIFAAANIATLSHDIEQWRDFNRL